MLIPSRLRFKFSLLAAIVLSAVYGCSSQSKSPVVPSPPVRVTSVRDGIAYVQSLPLYKQAEQACTRKHYVPAAHLLERLAAAPGLNPDETAFCNEQRNICLKDAGLLPKSAPAVAPVPVPAPRSAAEADCGPRALALACRQLGVSVSVASLRQWAGTTAKGTSMAGLAKAAKKAGLKAEGVQVNQEGLAHIDTPAIAWIRRRHYATITAVRGEDETGTATIHDPNQVKEETIPQQSLLQLCGGYLLLLHRR